MYHEQSARKSRLLFVFINSLTLYSRKQKWLNIRQTKIW